MNTLLTLLKEKTILKYVVGFIGFVLLMLIMTKCTHSHSTAAAAKLSNKATTNIGNASGDTPNETLKTLTAQVSVLTKQNKALADQNQLLNTKASEKEKTLSANITREVMQNVTKQLGNINTSDVSQLKQALEDVKKQVANNHSNTTDMPIGLGLTSDEVSSTSNGTWRWVDPMNGTATEAGTKEKASRWQTPQSAINTNVDTAALLDNSDTNNKNKKLSLKPYYTLPQNATLIDSVVMTALIGRTPVKNQVPDPYPFKVITGKDNLAANGIHIPHVAGMIWSGIAKGDMNLSCVMGDLTSVTFVFDDGTIRTMGSDENGNATGSGSNNTVNAKGRLGWISDPQGVPCISGKFLTNAPETLSQLILVNGVAAGAGAYAAAQTSTSLNPLGGNNTSITGSQGKYVLGQIAQGGAQSASQWITDRASQSFDAVFVPSGASIAVHIDREIQIDYDPKGRKVSYERNEAETSTKSLD